MAHIEFTINGIEVLKAIAFFIAGVIAVILIILYLLRNFRIY